MSGGPRPSPLVLASAILVLLPAGALIVVAFLALLDVARDPGEPYSLSGPAWLGAVLFPVPAALMILAERRAICRRDPVAVGWIAGLCLWIPALGSIGWVEGLLRLSGVLPRDKDWNSWGELAVYSAVLACAAVAGLGHLRWWRMLREAKP